MICGTHRSLITGKECLFRKINRPEYFCFKSKQNCKFIKVVFIVYLFPLSFREKVSIKCHPASPHCEEGDCAVLQFLDHGVKIW